MSFFEAFRYTFSSFLILDGICGIDSNTNMLQIRAIYFVQKSVASSFRFMYATFFRKNISELKSSNWLKRTLERCMKKGG